MPAAGNPHFSIHPDAEEELVAAAQYYDQRRSGLGDEFLRQMQRLIEFALENPELGTPKGSGIRWFLSSRFPYALVYRWSSEEMQVIAFMHLRRRPGYWRARTGE